MQMHSKQIKNQLQTQFHKTEVHKATLADLTNKSYGTMTPCIDIIKWEFPVISGRNSDEP